MLQTRLKLLARRALNLRVSTIITLLLFLIIAFLLLLPLLGVLDTPGDKPCPNALLKYGVRFNPDSSKIVIPRHLHQVFKDSLIPRPYHESMRSWQRQNPDWHYFFWTDVSVERMIRDKYPEYLDLFLSYEHPLQKADTMRYFILHQYGGVYSDLDMEALKPMNSYLKSNSCVLVPEPKIQTNLIFNMENALTNCIMASAAGHPFMDYVLLSLPGAYRKVVHNWDVLHSTGPFFLNKTYTDYKRKFPSSRSVDSLYHVHIADHRYLVPTFDAHALKYEVLDNKEGFCDMAKISGKLLRKKACDQLLTTKFKNDLPPEAVTNHLWLHLGWDIDAYFKMDRFVLRKDICDLVPTTIMYEHIQISNMS